MKVLDFINAYSDSMNESEFFQTLDALADAYAISIARTDFAQKERIRENALLSAFLLQEMEKTASGAFKLIKAPNIVTLRFLNGMNAANEM